MPIELVGLIALIVFIAIVGFVVLNAQPRYYDDEDPRDRPTVMQNALMKRREEDAARLAERRGEPVERRSGQPKRRGIKVIRSPKYGNLVVRLRDDGYYKVIDKDQLYNADEDQLYLDE